MFKYVKYTPFEDEYAIHEFNELNDKTKIHMFDVPCVSVEYDNEDDFLELMLHQKKEIGAVEITKDEFSVLVKDTDQVQRIYDVANETYVNEMEALSKRYSSIEMATWPSQVDEARAVKRGDTVPTPYLSAIANDDGISIAAAADKILVIKDAYDTYASDCLTRKWAIVSKLKADIGL